MSVKAFDINSDYVLVAWKPPNTVNEAPISGYFVDRSVRRNESPLKIKQTSKGFGQLLVQGAICGDFDKKQ